MGAAAALPVANDSFVLITFSLLFHLSLFRKYLRDGDRQVLAKRVFFLTVKVLEDNLNSLTGVRKPQPLRSFHTFGRF